MGSSEADARHAVTHTALQLGVVPDGAMLRDAAGQVDKLPQPVEDDLDDVERADAVREMLGLTSPIDQLNASLRARAWLQEWAAEGT